MNVFAKFIARKKKHRLTYKLLFYVVLCSSLFTLITTTFQLYYGYQQDLETIENNIQFIQKNYLFPIAINIYKINKKQIRLELQSALQLKDIGYLEIREQRGKKIINIFEGNPDLDKNAARRFPLEYRNAGELISLGSLIVVPDLKGVHQRLWDKVWFILMTNALKTFLCCFCILAIIQLLIARHLNKIANYVEQLQLDKLGHKLVLDRKSAPDKRDELDYIVMAINNTQSTIKQSMEEIESAKQANHLRQNEQSKRFERIQRQQTSLIELTMNEAVAEANIELSTHFMTELIATTLEVERVGVWFFNNDKAQINCINQFILSNKEHKRGMSTNTLDYPNYFQTQIKEWIIVANDAQNDFRTREFTPNYFRPLGIASVLNVAFRVESKVIGIISLEHIGEIRNWADDEIAFVRAVSDQLTQILLIDQHKKTEEQLQQAQKMDSIGQIAGGIAHDFNNMLSGILGAADLLYSETGNNERQNKYIKLILDVCERATDLTHKLLAFSRKKPVTENVINCHEILKDVTSILERSIDKRITLSINLHAENFNIAGDSNQLQNCFINLGVNARDALPKGGVITITTENVMLNEIAPELNTFGATPGEFLQISIKDNGLGIPENIRSRIFEPFFTTKKIGQGTGLGLATVYGAMKEHRGAIHVRSELTKGTAFDLYFPVEKNRESKRRKKSGIVHGQGHILLVDDDDIVRVTVEELLIELGYKVLTASDGEEALECYKTNAEQIDIVILDIVMPKMGGEDCFREIKKVNPQAKVIISSGFTRSIVIDRLKDQGVCDFIKKPYRKFELSKVLGNIFNSNPLT